MTPKLPSLFLINTTKTHHIFTFFKKYIFALCNWLYKSIAFSVSITWHAVWIGLNYCMTTSDTCIHSIWCTMLKFLLTWMELITIINIISKLNFKHFSNGIYTTKSDLYEWPNNLINTNIFSSNCKDKGCFDTREYVLYTTCMRQKPCLT